MLAGFPCQPSSLAGCQGKCVRAGPRFACDTQGTLFFEVGALSTLVDRQYLCAKTSKTEESRSGKTFRIIMQTLDELGYDVADAADNGPDDPKFIHGHHFCLNIANVSCWWPPT
ncbi:DNA cytosine methyltransferase [Shigella flexneri]